MTVEVTKGQFCGGIYHEIYVTRSMENFIITSHTVYDATFILLIHVIAGSLPCSVQQAI